MGNNGSGSSISRLRMLRLGGLLIVDVLSLIYSSGRPSVHNCVVAHPHPPSRNGRQFVSKANVGLQLVQTNLLLEHVHHVISIPQFLASHESFGTKIQAICCSHPRKQAYTAKITIQTYFSLGMDKAGGLLSKNEWMCLRAILDSLPSGNCRLQSTNPTS